MLCLKQASSIKNYSTLLVIIQIYILKLQIYFVLPQDQLRKQLDNLKSDISRKSSSELETILKEKDDMIAQLHEEGEKLARQELQHSNIIKKLRAKEKDNEQVIKSLR